MRRLLMTMTMGIAAGALMAIVGGLLQDSAPLWAAITWAVICLVQCATNYKMLCILGLNEQTIASQRESIELNERTIAIQRESNERLWAALEREDNDANGR